MADREEKREMRIQRELDRFANDKGLDGICLWQDENDFGHFMAAIFGPDSTPYVGGIFYIEINLPEKYPFEPPHVRFNTKIWHPNIGHQSGAIRMSALNDWSPTMGLKSLLIALQALLSEPDLSEPMEEYYHASQNSFISNARYYTKKYAMEIDPLPQQTKRITRMPKRFDNFLL